MNNFNFFVYVYIALGVRLTALYRARFVYMGIVNCSKNEHAIFKSDEDTPLIQRMLVLMIPAILAGAYLSLALFPVTRLRSRPISLKLSIVSLIFLSLGARVYWAKKFNITKWNKILWAAGIMWSLPIIRAATPLVAVSTPGNKINKLLDRGIFLATIKRSESLIIKANKLRHSLISLQKILRISVLWGLLLRLYYLRNKLQKFIKNKALNPRFKTNKSKKKWLLWFINLEKENFFTTKVNSKKIMLR